MSAAITGIAIGAAGVGLSAASAAGAFTPGSTQPNVAQSVEQQVGGQLQVTPQNYLQQQNYNPKFAGINSQIAWNNLFGTPASTSNFLIQQNGYYDSSGNFLGPVNPGTSGAQYYYKNQTFTGNTPAAPGSLTTAETAQPRLLGMQTQARMQDIADVQNLGPAAYQSIASYNPQASALLTVANSQVAERLATNGALDPFTQTSLQQNFNSAEAARGLAPGVADSAMLSYYQQATENARQVQNIGLADSQVSANQNYYGDAFQQVLSRTSGGIQPGQPSYTANQPSATAATAALLNPSLTGLQSLGYQAQVGAQNAGYLSQQSGLGSLVQSLGPLSNAVGSYFNPPPSAQTTANVAASLAQPAVSSTDFFASPGTM